MMILPQENSFDKRFIAIFQAVSVFKRNLFGSLPTIVLDKYGIMRLHHEVLLIMTEEFNLQIKQLLEE
jgi:hypothetical protein